MTNAHKIILQEVRQLLKEYTESQQNINPSSISVDQYEWARWEWREENGKRLKDLVFKDKSGKPVNPSYYSDETGLTKKNVSLSTILPRGIVLVNLWSQWCLPCKQEIPFLQTVTSQRNINLIGILTARSDGLMEPDLLQHLVYEGFINPESRKYWFLAGNSRARPDRIPLNMLFIDGRLVAKAGAFSSAEDLESWLDKYTKPAQPAQPAPAAPAPAAAAAASQFKAGQRVIFTPTNRLFVVVSVNQDGTVNIKAPTSEKVYTNIDPKKLKIL